MNGISKYFREFVENISVFNYIILFSDNGNWIQGIFWNSCRDVNVLMAFQELLLYNVGNVWFCRSAALTLCK